MNNTNTTVPTIAELRRAGHKVRVSEFRQFPWAKGVCMPRHSASQKQPPLNKGGWQLIEITLKDGRELVGKAECSLKDNFNRKFGRELAISRALAGVENF